jgi:hypothetical protein
VKSGSDWSHWKDLNHKLIRQRLDKKQSDIANKFEDLRKHISSSDNPEPGTVTNQTLEAHQSLAQELISACYDIHCEVAADLGYEKSPAFVRTLYRRAVLPLIRELSKRENNLCHALAALPGRQGELTPLTEISSTCASNREIEWEARIEAEATEREHRENVSQRRVATPDLSQWTNLRIEFISDHRIRIRYPGRVDTMNYAEFGFEDKRTGNPRSAWSTLLELARHGGRLNQTPTKKWSKTEKHIQEIRRVLRDCFGNSNNDPIPFISGSGYVAAFHIGCSDSFEK